MHLAIVTRVRDRNAMEVADDLGTVFGAYVRMADKNYSGVIARSCNRTFWILLNA